MSKEYDLVFVNGVSSCGCTMNFSDGHGEYSDVHRINFCPRHSASEIARSIVATGELTRPEHESLEAEVCELARHPASADAYLNSVRAEGVHFAANRILAAWDAGFIDDTPAKLHDIIGAVLSALEFLPNASPWEFKRDFADEIRSGIAAQLRAGEPS